MSQSMGAEGARVGGATGSPSTSDEPSFSDSEESFSDWLLVDSLLMSLVLGGDLSAVEVMVPSTMPVSGICEGVTSDSVLLLEWG